MKILAIYRTYTLPLMRRVWVPFSVLAKRQHPFSFMQVDSFSGGLAFGADVTVLQNWRLDEQELETMRQVGEHRIFIVDCADPLLLEDELYRKQLVLARLVTVPNEWLRKEIRVINSTCTITPSCVDPEFFASANRDPKPSVPVIGCLGPYDWYLIKDALLEIHQAHPKIVVYAEPEAAKILGDFVTPVEPTPQNIAGLLHRCSFGLCPYDGVHGWDTIWEREYGILCKPVITLQPSYSSQKEYWIKEITAMLSSSSYRAALGQKAFQLSNKLRATMQAGIYSKVYKEKLPHLLLT